MSNNIEKIDRIWSCNVLSILDDAETLTSEVHDPYARTTGA